MTTWWMCCSCWWHWCRNILDPWCRPLTSGTAFGIAGARTQLFECCPLTASCEIFFHSWSCWQCDLQASGIQKWRDQSADAQSAGILPQTFAPQVSTISVMIILNGQEGISLVKRHYLHIKSPRAARKWKRRLYSGNFPHGGDGGMRMWAFFFYRTMQFYNVKYLIFLHK